MQNIMGDVGDWESDAQAVAGYMETALRNDAGTATVPLIDPTVASPAGIQSHFGGPTYNKGGSFLRMIRAMLGEDKFYAAVREFLKDYQFSNALSVDLFRYFAAQWSDLSKDLNAILYAWGSQRGFPLITVTDASNTTNRVWTLTQSMYNLTDNQQWPVWVQYSAPTGIADGIGQVWLDSSNSYTNQIVTSLDVNFIKLNYNRTAFYRVLYPLPAYNDFRTALDKNPNILTKQDRIGLIADTYWTQMDKYLKSWDTVLNVTLPVLRNEVSYPVWATGITVLNDIHARLRFAIQPDANNTHLFHSYVRMLTEPVSNQLAWDLDIWQHRDQHLTGMMQVNFGPLACRFGVAACWNVTNRLYQYWSTNGMSEAVLPTANLRLITMGYGAKQVNGSQMLFGMYADPSKSPTPQLATLYLEGSMIAARPADIDTLLQLVTAPILPSLRYSDTIPSLLARLNALNDIAHPTILAKLLTTPTLIDNLLKPYDNAPDRRAFDTLIDTLVGSVQIREQLDAMKSTIFTSDRMASLSQRSQDKINSAYVRAQANIDWVDAEWPQMRAAMLSTLDMPRM